MAEGTRKPWWAAAIAGGFGAVLGVAYLIAQPAQGREPREPRVTASSVLPAGTLSLDERLSRMESSIDGLQDQVRELRDRLPPKHGP